MNLFKILFLGVALTLVSCDWNRSAKAQRQEYRKLPKNGPDYTLNPLQLKRQKDYFMNELADDMLEKMRQR